MSRSLNLTCDKCRQRIWIGQSSYLYFGEPETMKAMETFMVAHMFHPLRVIDDNDERAMEGEDVTPNTPRVCLSRVNWILKEKQKEGMDVQLGSTAFKSLLAWSELGCTREQNKDLNG